MTKQAVGSLLSLTYDITLYPVAINVEPDFLPNAEY